MVSVRTYEPSFRARLAETVSSKKSQTWPPFPERDRSRAAGRENLRQVSTKAPASSCQFWLSKSAAKK
jgi:hypothetical protein